MDQSPFKFTSVPKALQKKGSVIINGNTWKIAISDWYILLLGNPKNCKKWTFLIKKVSQTKTNIWKIFYFFNFVAIILFSSIKRRNKFENILSDNLAAPSMSTYILYCSYCSINCFHGNQNFFTKIPWNQLLYLTKYYVLWINFTNIFQLRVDICFFPHCTVNELRRYFSK